MPIARNEQGEYFSVGPDGQLSPAKIAVNPETGARYIQDGSSLIPEPPPQRSTGERVVRGVGMPAQGWNESLATGAGAIPDMVSSGIRAVEDFVSPPQKSAGGDAEKGYLFSKPPGYFTDLARKGINAVTSLGGLLPDAPKPETRLEHLLYAGGKGVGDAASVLIPATAIASTAKAGGMASGLAKALSAQPGAQIASGVTGGVVGEATDSPALGLAAALMTPAALSGASRAVLPIRPNVTPETQRLIDVMEAHGVPLTAAQQTGSKPLKILERAFDNLPLTSGPQEAFRQGQREAFNRASLGYSNTPGISAAPDIVAPRLRAIGGEIGDIASRNVLDITPQVETKLNGIADDITRNYSADVAKPVINRINEVLNHVDGRTIPGEFYQNLDSQLGKQIKAVDSGVQRTALGEVRTALRSAMDDSISPADRAAWQQARSDYANLKVTQAAANGAGANAATGNVSPLGLKGALEKSVGRDAYGLGRGAQNDLARGGQAFLRDASDPGTAGVLNMQNLLTFGGTGGLASMAGASPLSAILAGTAGLAGPRAAQLAYNSAPMQRYLTQGIPGMAGLANQAPQVNQELVAALLGQRVKDVLPGQKR